jgi:hypothetical protein
LSHAGTVPGGRRPGADSRDEIPQSGVVSCGVTQQVIGQDRIGELEQSGQAIPILP